jgi:flagellar basal body-associated protein FliL
MKEMNKKGDEHMIWIIIIIVLAVVVLIILAFFFSDSIKKGSNSTQGLIQCEAQGKGAGCFSEDNATTKENDGFHCTKGILGCKSDSTTPYCCYKLFG